MTVAPRGSGWRLPLRVAGSLLLAMVLLGGVEGGLALGGMPPDGIYAGDPGVYWTLRPGLDAPAVRHVEEGGVFTVRTDALGLRVDAREPAIPDAGPWVLALGCSTTFGWGVSAADAWPARLEARLGVPVVNAGVPGHSTAQGRAYAPDLLARRPTVVLLGWLVRDAQLAPSPDSAARPTPWVRRTRIARTLQLLRASRGAVPTPTTGVPRVDAATFAANLGALVAQARAQRASPALLAVPMVTPPVAHLRAMATVDAPVLAPSLPRDAFFARDPIHLTVAGNDTLAEALSGPVGRLLEEAVAPARAPTPTRTP